MQQPQLITDEAYAHFIKFLEKHTREASLNEDTTRLRLIDAIAIDVLHWDRNQVTTEKYVRAEGFADYVFSTRGGPSLVLEAKRVGSSFVLPERVYPDRAVPFTLIRDQCPDAFTAMQQALNYANSLGIRFTAISNGHQWLLMLTHVDSVALENRNVLVFESLTAIKQRFPRFWDAFSPISIAANRPHSLLIDIRSLAPPLKLSASIINYPVPRSDQEIRNRFATPIQYLWDEINNTEGTETFFKECYVQPSSHGKNEHLAKELLTNRADADAAALQRVSGHGAITELVAEYKPEKPVVLLGRIGHGKSTFIKYLKLVAAPDQLSRYVQMDIDFLHLPSRADQVSSYVYSEICKQLFERHNFDVFGDKFVRAALNGRLNQFKKTPRAIAYKNDKTEYLKAELDFLESQTSNRHEYFADVFRHLKGSQGHSVAIFFDNLDKRLDTIQEEAFLLASAMARDYSALVFICLRPGTFYRSRESGVLDSIAPRLIEVHSPPLPVFLRRRFEYARAIVTSAKPPPRGEAVALSKEITAHASDVAQLFQALSDSVRNNKDLAFLFESVSNGNLRLVLSYVGSVITSGHLKTSEMLEAIQESGTYRVAEHQALRALLYGDNHHYDPARPPFVNLFDLSHADPLEHFTRPICLYHLAEVSDSISQGFIEHDELSAKMSAYTFSPSLIEDTFAFLFTKKCIEDDRGGEDWLNAGHRLRITALGRYHIQYLISKFVYLDAIVADTPILAEHIRAQILDVEPLLKRLNRAENFLRYLNQCARGFMNTAFAAKWDRVSQELAEDIADISLRV